jgi:hypothetical protein
MPTSSRVAISASATPESMSKSYASSPSIARQFSRTCHVTPHQVERGELNQFKACLVAEYHFSNHRGPSLRHVTA